MKNDFDKLFGIVLAEAKAAGIPVSDNITPHIVVNTRARSFFGQCICNDGQYTIQLSALLYDVPEKKCRQTIAHELIHTCNGCYNHGAAFKKYAAIMNSTYDYNIQSANTTQEMGIIVTAANSKYIIQCRKCGAVFTRSRWCSFVENPTRYRCGCGGELIRVK